MSNKTFKIGFTKNVSKSKTDIEKFIWFKLNKNIESLKLQGFYKKQQ